jgi:hypothetical protein
LRLVRRRRPQELVPLRYARRAVSPFTFLRGSAQVMAFDLASGPSTELEVRLCGDAHISNFGVFASPERRLVFDLNDFDEAAPGPFEWDVKRLAASIVVAGRDKGLDRVANRRAVLDAVAAYRDWTERYSKLTHLDVWYARIEVQDILETMATTDRRYASREVRRMQGKNHVKALSKLTAVDADGRRRIVDDPPLITHIDGAADLQRVSAHHGVVQEEALHLTGMEQVTRGLDRGHVVGDARGESFLELSADRVELRGVEGSVVVELLRPDQLGGGKRAPIRGVDWHADS